MTGRRSLLGLTLVVVGILALASPAGAVKPGEITSYKVPGCFPEDLAPAASQGVLIRLCAGPFPGRVIGSLGNVLRSGKIARRPIPKNAVGPFALGPGGEVWAAAEVGGGSLDIDRIAPDDTVAKFPLGTPQDFNTLKVYGLVPDGEGAVWAAAGELAPEYYGKPFISLGGELLHIAADGTVTRFPVPESIEPQALVRGPDGNLWFVGESGRSSGEHSYEPGKGYVGRMTPTGELTLFPTPTEQSSPGGIAVGPDGRLWFTETTNRAEEIATIDTDGTFGPSIRVRDGYLGSPLAFGPEGDAWLPALGGVMRITSQGQETVFPMRETQGVVVGAEGDIWTRREKLVERIVPGAPGIDPVKIEADRRSKTVRVQLACGGSTQGCEGMLTLSLAHDRGTEPGARLIRAHYAVAAESQRELTLRLSAKDLALARQTVPKRAGPAYVAPVVVHATVAGGPTLDRRIYVPGLVKAPGSTAFRIPGCLSRDAAHLAPAPAGGVLVRTCESPGDGWGTTLSALLPTGELVPHAVPESAGGPIAAGPAGELWLAENPELVSNGEQRGDAAIDRVAADGSVQSFPIEPPGESAGFQIYGLVVGEDGGAWAATGHPEFNGVGGYNSSGGGELIRIAPDGGVSRFEVPSDVEPQGLVLGPDGNLWFTGVEGVYSSEHTWSYGTGYIGRMTPAGKFSLYPTPRRASEPKAIAVGPEGRIWFTEPSNHVRSIASIDTDGKFGPAHKVRVGRPYGELAVGPEGDVWLSNYRGLQRVTGDGQETVFPEVEARAVTLGSEGDLWSLGRGVVHRIVPGAPGLDIWKVSADRRAETIRLRLACGGSEKGCRGSLSLALRQRARADKGKPLLIPLARAAYSVPGESKRTVTMKIISTDAFAKALRHGARAVIAHASVEGGPDLERLIRIRRFMTK